MKLHSWHFLLILLLLTLLGVASLRSLQGQVIENGTVIVVDDRGAGEANSAGGSFARIGPWAHVQHEIGFQGDLTLTKTVNLWDRGESGRAGVQWTFPNLEPGTYRVWTTWKAFSALSEQVPYTVFDDRQQMQVYTVDQRQEPDEEIDGRNWYRFDDVSIASNTLRVRQFNITSDTAYVIADAVRIEKLRSVPFCGDGIVDPDERCDGEVPEGFSCMGHGFTGGELRCNDECTFEFSECFRCGDGQINEGEVCDGRNLDEQTCASQDFEGGLLFCSEDCTEFDTSSCFKCGDGKIDGGEECDRDELGTASCVSEGFSGGELSCTSECMYETSACFRCGDGVVNPGEQCDGRNTGFDTCRTQGFENGLLRCTDQCMFDLEHCYNGRPECSDGIDNDDDGLIDFIQSTGMGDPGCEVGMHDTSEGTYTSACQDGVDNDNDGLRDEDDPGCFNAQDNDEYNFAEGDVVLESVVIDTCSSHPSVIITAYINVDSGRFELRDSQTNEVLNDRNYHPLWIGGLSGEFKIPRHTLHRPVEIGQEVHLYTYNNGVIESESVIVEELADCNNPPQTHCRLNPNECERQTQSVGPHFAKTTGGSGWRPPFGSNYDYIGECDVAGIEHTGRGITQTLQTYNYDFAIPEGARIENIELQLSKLGHSSVQEYGVRLSHGSVLFRQEHGGTDWLGQHRYVPMTQASMGTVFPHQVNRNDFGLSIQANHRNGHEDTRASLDCAQITIEYSELAYCGDRVVEGTEQCDDGNQRQDDGCNNECQRPTCGNQIIDRGEMCDDGNREGGDGCSHNCLLEGDPSAYCVDSDLQNFGKRGSVYTNYQNGKVWNDGCLVQTSPGVKNPAPGGECSGSTCFVTEELCVGSKRQSQTIPCNRCVRGACESF